MLKASKSKVLLTAKKICNRFARVLLPWPWLGFVVSYGIRIGSRNLSLCCQRPGAASSTATVITVPSVTPEHTRALRESGSKPSAALTVLMEVHFITDSCVADGKREVRFTQTRAVPAFWQRGMLADVLPESLRLKLLQIPLQLESAAWVPVQL